MYKYILDSVNQIDWWGITPLVLFFSFFVVMTIRVLRTDKEHVDEMSMLPLDDRDNI